MSLLRRLRGKGWNAPESTDELRRRLDYLLNDFVTSVPRTGRRLAGEFVPEMDVKEGETEVTVWVEVPGVLEEDLDISMDEGRLVVSGEKKGPAEGEEDLFLSAERSFGRFSRSIPISVPVEEDGIEAFLQQGVLTVHLPKTSASRPRQIEIKSEA